MRGWVARREGWISGGGSGVVEEGQGKRQAVGELRKTRLGVPTGPDRKQGLTSQRSGEKGGVGVGWHRHTNSQ